MTFTSGAGWRQRGIFKVASLVLWPKKGENLKPVANAKAKIPPGLNSTTLQPNHAPLVDNQLVSVPDPST
jgi:hypothetical protein